MAILAWAFSTGWASGISGYSVVLILGVAGRFFGIHGVPPGLERTDVLVAAAVLFLVELVADKIPYVDSAWDAIHTVIRPAIGATVAALLAGQSGSLSQVAAAATGGLAALASHAVKAGIRAAVHTLDRQAGELDPATAGRLRRATLAELAHLEQMLGHRDADDDAFDVAVATFAHAYADQNERDHQQLVRAIASGRIRAEAGT